LNPCVSKGISLFIIELEEDFDFVLIEDLREFGSKLFFLSPKTNFFSCGLGAGRRELVYTLDFDISLLLEILL